MKQSQLKMNVRRDGVRSTMRELTSQEKALIASLVTHDPVLGYAIGYHGDDTTGASVLGNNTIDLNQTKDPVHTPNYYPARYSWDTRHKYKCGIVSFHAHSGIPCATTQVGRSCQNGYVEYWTATYNYEDVPLLMLDRYIEYILSLGITYMWKSIEEDMVMYDFHFYVNRQYVSVMISYYEGNVSVMHMLHE